MKKSELIEHYTKHLQYEIVDGVLTHEYPEVNGFRKKRTIMFDGDYVLCYVNSIYDESDMVLYARCKLENIKINKDFRVVFDLGG